MHVDTTYLKLHHYNKQTMSQNFQAKLCCEKLDTSQDLKSFAIGSFLKGFVVRIANDYLC